MHDERVCRAIIVDPWQGGGVSGSVGGAVFGRANGVIVVRKRGIPARRLRSTQPFNRATLGFLARNYGNLTAGQREGWEAYAADHPLTNSLGQEFIGSGINMYVMLNHHLVRMFGGGEKIDAAPVDDPQATIVAFTAVTGVGAPGDVDLDWAFVGTEDADDKIEIRVAGPYISPAKQEVFERKVFNSTVVGNLAVKVVSGLTEQMWYWFYGRYVDKNGQTTAWQTAQATPMLTP